MNTIDEAIEILQAMKEGKTIQIQAQAGGWVDRSPAYAGVLPRFQDSNYRVKPEPVFDWAVERLKTASEAEWQESGTVYGKTESEMKKMMDQWTTVASRHYPHKYRARKVAPVEEALT